MDNFLVYIHIRPDTNEPFYVGKGIPGREDKLSGRNIFWKNIVSKNNNKFISKIIYSNLSESDALLKERQVELELRGNGYKLVNIVECGIIGGMTNRKHSKESINKMSEALKKHFSTNPSKRKGCKMSEESSLKKSKAMMGQKVRLGIKDSDETKKNKSEAFKKRNIDWTYRNLMVSQKTRIPILQYDLQGNFIKEWDSVTEFETKTGLKSNGAICLCCQGKQKKTLGYIWKYKINKNEEN